MDRDLGRARAFYDLAARRFRSVPSLNAAFAQWREVFHCENLQRHKSFNRLTKQTLMQTIQYFPFNACVTNLIVSQTDRKSTVRTNFDLQLWTCTTISWPFSNKLILIFLKNSSSTTFATVFLLYYPFVLLPNRLDERSEEDDHESETFKKRRFSISFH